ncbi:hypothetical protein HAX54_014666 [Datura stramonium]|uniref:Uncharacterized protein n=1 Tax=Datura stramonium TaxID=4076 RepID=A0ABS8TR76_DATST|nr:hypothetical protein [Datura stramonium]
MDLGLSGSDLVNVIAKDTTVVVRGLVTHLRPTIDLHRLGSDENVVRALKGFPWMLTFGIHHIMETNLLLFKNHGVPDERIIFKSFGWSDDDILEMFRKLPYCVAFSAVRIQKALNLFMKELGLGPAYLVSHPVLKILDEKKLERRKLALYTVVSLTETKFIEYFMLHYKDQNLILTSKFVPEDRSKYLLCYGIGGNQPSENSICSVAVNATMGAAAAVVGNVG